jgi:hypothetical protein
MRTIIEDLEQLNLNYDVKGARSQRDQAPASSQGAEEAKAAVEEASISVYQAHNDAHQQYLKRLADFLEVFLPKCHNDWLLRWVPTMSEVLIKKTSETPRIPRLYQILRSLMQTCNKYRYFEHFRQQTTDRASREDEKEGQESL